MGSLLSSCSRPVVALVAFAPLSVVAAVACSTSPDDVAAAPDPTPTYHRDVAPILQRRCVKCHEEGGIGPFPLTTYAKARAMAPIMNVEVGARRMPPWGAQTTDECAPPIPWRDDERMTDEEILTLKRWEEAGTPEGSPADGLAEALPVQSMELASPTLVLTPRAAYTPASAKSDEFRCFVFDAPGFEDGGFVSAVNVIPGNRKIVHHVSVFSDVGGRAAMQAGPDGSFDCPPGFSASLPTDEAPTLAWMFAWAPGGKPLELPSNMGIRVEPNSKIVMEVHYSTGGRAVEPDLTRIQITRAAEKPEYTVTSWGIGNFGAQAENGDGLQPGPEDRNGVAEFRIPVNARDHVESMRATAYTNVPLRMFGFRPHAHLAAVDIKLDFLKNGAEECMMQDRWDFHWQRVYTYDAPIDQLPLVETGDKVRIRCTYDNSTNNRRLAQELYERALPPMDIALGDATLDEMCLVDVLLVKKTP